MLRNTLIATTIATVATGAGIAFAVPASADSDSTFGCSPCVEIPGSSGGASTAAGEGAATEGSGWEVVGSPGGIVEKWQEFPEEQTKKWTEFPEKQAKKWTDFPKDQAAKWGLAPSDDEGDGEGE